MPQTIHNVVMTSTVRSFGIALLLVALAYGPGRADEALYAKRCAGCHSNAASLAVRLSGRTTADVAANLDRFLSHHHMDDAAERSRITQWLATLSHKAL